MNYSELLQLAKGWGNFISDRIIILRLPRKSIELANQKNYLDLLYRVYPISENVRREMSDSTKNDISNFFNGRNNIELLKILIDQTNKKQIVFPIKDSYVAFLKHDNSAIDRKSQYSR